jgi:hypothetical protein
VSSISQSNVLFNQENSHVSTSGSISGLPISFIAAHFQNRTCIPFLLTCQDCTRS